MVLEFTDQEIQTIDKAIQQLPYCLAIPLITTINRQIAEQLKNRKKTSAASTVLRGGGELETGEEKGPLASESGQDGDTGEFSVWGNETSNR
jgi:hypothetical protein